MSKVPIPEHFLSAGESQGETEVVFQAKTQAKMFLLNRAPGAEEGGAEQEEEAHVQAERHQGL